MEVIWRYGGVKGVAIKKERVSGRSRERKRERERERDLERSEGGKGEGERVRK